MPTELCPLTYAPLFEAAQLREELVSESYTAVWLDNIVTPDEDCVIEYAFIIQVFSRKHRDPVLYLSSERRTSYQDDPSPRMPGEDRRSHFLCMFDAEGHHNFGSSDAWSDPLRFRTAALEHIASRTGERLERKSRSPRGRSEVEGRG